MFVCIPPEKLCCCRNAFMHKTVLMLQPCFGFVKELLLCLMRQLPCASSLPGALRRFSFHISMCIGLRMRGRVKQQPGRKDRENYYF